MHIKIAYYEYCMYITNIKYKNDMKFKILISLCTRFNIYVLVASIYVKI